MLPHEKQDYADAAAGTAAHKEMETELGSEVAFAYDVLARTAREIGRRIGREYGKLADSEIPGTTDLLTLDGDSLKITDYKSGSGYAEQLAGVTDKPWENLQLCHNALCASIVYGKSEAQVEVVYLKTGEIKEGWLDMFDFAEIRERLKRIWQSCMAAGEALKLPGDGIAQFVKPDKSRQCWRCPAKPNCPAWRKR